jgi:hypothetical protein
MQPPLPCQQFHNATNNKLLHFPIRKPLCKLFLIKSHMSYAKLLKFPHRYSSYMQPIRISTNKT